MFKKILLWLGILLIIGGCSTSKWSWEQRPAERIIYNYNVEPWHYRPYYLYDWYWRPYYHYPERVIVVPQYPSKPDRPNTPVRRRNSNPRRDPLRR